MFYPVYWLCLEKYHFWLSALERVRQMADLDAPEYIGE